jgi:hypothetical protein
MATNKKTQKPIPPPRVITLSQDFAKFSHDMVLSVCKDIFGASVKPSPKLIGLMKLVAIASIYAREISALPSVRGLPYVKDKVINLINTMLGDDQMMVPEFRYVCAKIHSILRSSEGHKLDDLTAQQLSVLLFEPLVKPDDDDDDDEDAANKDEDKLMRGDVLPFRGVNLALFSSATNELTIQLSSNDILTKEEWQRQNRITNERQNIFITNIKDQWTLCMALTTISDDNSELISPPPIMRRMFVLSYDLKEEVGSTAVMMMTMSEEKVLLQENQKLNTLKNMCFPDYQASLNENSEEEEDDENTDKFPFANLTVEQLLHSLVIAFCAATLVKLVLFAKKCDYIIYDEPPSWLPNWLRSSSTEKECDVFPRHHFDRNEATLFETGLEVATCFLYGPQLDDKIKKLF